MYSLLDSDLMEPFSTAMSRESVDESIRTESSVDLSPNHRNTVTIFGKSEVFDYNLSKINPDLPKKSIFSRNFYISSAWSPQLYFTARGAENFHIYLWIAKDLCWIQYFHTPAIVFGSLALAWCAVLFYHALKDSWEDAYMLVGLTLWLTGNFVWMHGEVTSDDDAIVGPQASIFFEVRFSSYLRLSS
jgi:hypothetical protein